MLIVSSQLPTMVGFFALTSTLCPSRCAARELESSWLTEFSLLRVELVPGIHLNSAQPPPTLRVGDARQH